MARARQRDPTPAEKQRIMACGKSLSHSDVYGVPARGSELVSLVRSIPRDVWLDKLALILLFMANDGFHTPTFRKWVADNLLPEEAVHYLRALPAPEREIVYPLIDQQGLCLAKLALREAPKEVEASLLPPDVRPVIGRAALVMADEIAECEAQLATRAGGEEGDESDAVSTSVRGLSLVHHERFDRLVRRYHAMWFKHMACKKWRANGIEYDMERAFAELSKGLTLARFFSFGPALRDAYADVITPAPGAPPRQFSRDPKTWMAKTSLSPADLGAALALVLQTPDEALGRLDEDKGEKSGFWPTSFTPFRKRPLIQLTGGGVVPISLDFLVERTSSGIYWDIFDHMRDRFCIEAAYRFAECVGQALEDYTYEVVSELFSHLPPQHVERHPTEGPDVVVALDGEMIWFEVSVVRLRMELTKISGDVTELDAEVIGTPRTPGKLFQKLMQLSRAVAQFRGAGLDPQPRRLAGTSYGEVNRIWPVVVTLESLPLNVFTWARIRDKVEEWRRAGEREFLTDAKLGPVQIMSVGNVEEVCELQPDCGSLLNLLLTKRDSGRLAESWDNFLYYERTARGWPTRVDEINERLRQSDAFTFVCDTLGLPG